MNERVMQFRIGMFVIVAGLVLTMLIVWFGESPALFRDHTYVRVHFTEAPGVSEGIPVRKSGIRIGEVAAVAFDERPGQPDGVLVTLSLDRKFKIRAGAIPRISRALIGDVSIDMLPGAGVEPMRTSNDPNTAPIIEGSVAPDPANALVTATATLETINKAAAGIADVTKKVQNADQFIDTWTQTGKRFSTAAESVDRFIRANEGDFQPAVANIRQVSEKLNTTFDADTQSQLKAGIDRFSTAAARLDAGLAQVQPLLKDLGAPVSDTPTTNFGWGVLRFNRVLFDVSLLTRTLGDSSGSKLNSNGSLQRLVTRSELYDNMNRMAIHMDEFFSSGKVVLKNLNTFSEKVAKDPAAMARGALRGQ